MANADLKTKKTSASVRQFIDGIKDEKRREDSRQMLDIMRKASGEEPKMWGPSVVGFGDYHYKYESGRENDWFMMGFSPRKEALTLYFMTGIEPHARLLEKLGKHKTGKGCLYIKDFDAIDTGVLEQMIKATKTALSKKK